MLDFSHDQLIYPIADAVNEMLPRLPGALVTLLVGIVVIRLLLWLAEAILGLVKLPKGLRGILESMIHFLLWIGLLVTILQTLGLGSLAIIVSGSVAVLGIALATGATALVQDVLAGIFLAKDRNFTLGGNIIAGDPPVEGVVESMDMRRVRIRSKDGHLHVIPNSVVERKEWVVLDPPKS